MKYFASDPQISTTTLVELKNILQKWRALQPSLQGRRIPDYVEDDVKLLEECIAKLEEAKARNDQTITFGNLYQLTADKDSVVAPMRISQLLLGWASLPHERGDVQVQVIQISDLLQRWIHNRERIGFNAMPDPIRIPFYINRYVKGLSFERKKLENESYGREFSDIKSFSKENIRNYEAMLTAIARTHKPFEMVTLNPQQEYGFNVIGRLAGAGTSLMRRLNFEDATYTLKYLAGLRKEKQIRERLETAEQELDKLYEQIDTFEKGIRGMNKQLSDMQAKLADQKSHGLAIDPTLQQSIQQIIISIQGMSLNIKKLRDRLEQVDTEINALKQALSNQKEYLQLIRSSIFTGKYRLGS